MLAGVDTTTIRHHLAATRPGFLAVTAMACVLGIVVALACGCGGRPWAAAATLVLALLAHASANVYNDWADDRLGSDAINEDRISPFSGGSRLIQDGALSAARMREWAAWLALPAIGGGIVLAALTGPGLLLIGLAGAAIAWAYSSPRIALMSRGAGELAVAAAWWLVVVGADYVQRQRLHDMAAIAGVSYALLVAAILLVNEFPDRRADGAVGKRTLVVRLGPEAALVLYAAIVALAHGWVAAWWWTQWLPTQAWWALGSAPLSLAAAWLLARHAPEPRCLRPAIVLTLAAALLHGALLAAAFGAVLWQR
jgi:1,4-dihydroxy-2-naphthoate octaprenyltransferase